MPNVGVMCWNLHFCSINRFLTDGGTATGFANLVAGIAMGEGMGILGLLEIMDGGQNNPGGAWRIGNELKTRLNATQGSSGNWDFQVGSRQLGDSECNIFLWDGAQVVPNQNVLPGPFFSPCVVNAAAFSSLQAKYTLADTDVQAIITWLRQNNIIKPKAISSRINGVVVNSYKYVTASFTSILNGAIGSGPPIPTPVSNAGSETAYTSDLYQTLKNIDFLWFHQEADRSPFIGSFLCGTSQTPLTVAIFHAPKPAGMGALTGTIPVGLSRFLQAQPNVVVMGDFNCGVNDTTTVTDAYGYNDADAKWQKMGRLSPFQAITDTTNGMGASYWELGSTPVQNSTQYTRTTLCTKCPGLNAPPQSMRVSPYDRLFFKGADFALSTADCGDIVSWLMQASTDDNAKGLSQALCQYFPKYFPRTEKGKSLDWTAWLAKKIGEADKEIKKIGNEISKIQQRIDDEEDEKQQVSKSSKKITRGSGGNSKGKKKKSVASMRSSELDLELSIRKSKVQSLSNVKATYDAATALVESPAKIVTQSGEAWVLVTKAVSDHLPIYTTLAYT